MPDARLRHVDAQGPRLYDPAERAWSRREWRELRWLDADGAAVAAMTTGDLLKRVGTLIEKYVVLPSEEARTAIELFVLHSWAIEAAHSTPYMAIVSAEKQSGKTRLLEVVALVVREP